MGPMIEGILLAGLALLGIREGLRLRSIASHGSDVVGPGWYVFIISVILLAGAGVYLFVNLRRQKIAWPRGISVRLGPASWAMGTLALYTAIIPYTGYAIGSGLFFILTFRVFGVKTWVWSIVFGLVTAVIFVLFFSYIAGISVD